ncbi:MAG: hypothetical protein ACKO16_03880 [Gemmataceae bacterium]|jgi:hypothetical protein
MARLSLYLALATFLSLLAVSGFVLYSIIRHEPNFYKTALLVSNDPNKGEKSREFTSECFEFIGAVGTEKEWYAQFKEDQINSFFSEELDEITNKNKFFPDNIKAPRISLEPDRLRLAFRWGEGKLSTIISAELKLWLAKDEPNVIAVQLYSIKAGALPVSLLSMFDRISDTARQNGIEVSWYRHQGKPVAVVRFQADQPRPTMLLQALEIEKGFITLRGKNLDSNRPEIPAQNKQLSSAK